MVQLIVILGQSAHDEFKQQFGTWLIVGETSHTLLLEVPARLYTGLVKSLRQVGYICAIDAPEDFTWKE